MRDSTLHICSPSNVSLKGISRPREDLLLEQELLSLLWNTLLIAKLR